MSLQTVGNSHIYTIDGVEYPSVTTILATLKKDLGGWIASVTAGYVVDQLSQYKGIEGPGIISITENCLSEICEKAKMAHKNISIEAMDKGSDIHHEIEAYFELGIEPEKPGNMWLAFKEWLNTHNVVKRVSEHETFSPTHKYAGTCDFVGEIDGVLTVIDWKTSARIYREYVLQVSAYRASEMEINGWDIKQGAILRLDKKSKKPKAEFEVYSAKTMDKAFESFKHLCKYYHSESEARNECKFGS